MLQGSNISKGYKGMRKGISLVEMLVAILLFGIVGTIGYAYYKNFFDVRDESKKMRVYAIVDQAAQLANAYDLYVIKNGDVPLDINAIVQDGILVNEPPVPEGVSISGWELESNVTFSSMTTGEPAFRLEINGPDLNSTRLKYCNILNEVAAPGDYNGSWTDADINYSKDMWRTGLDANNSFGEMEYFHCADTNWTTGGSDNNFSFFFRIVEFKTGM